MAEILYKKLKEILEKDFPAGLHEKIMKSIVFIKFRKIFLAVASLLSLNLIFSLWNLWVKIAETELITIFKVMFEDIEFDYTVISGFFRAIWDSVPMVSIIFFVFSSSLVLFFSLFIYKFKHDYFGKAGLIKNLIY